MATTYELRSQFHGGVYSTHKSLRSALRESARHARECCCDPGVVLCGPLAELEALGAEDTVGGLVLRIPEGDFLCEEVDEE